MNKIARNRIRLQSRNAIKKRGLIWYEDLKSLDKAWPRADKKWADLEKIIEINCLAALSSGVVQDCCIDEYWQAMAGLARSLVYPKTSKGFAGTRYSKELSKGFGKQFQDLFNYANGKKNWGRGVQQLKLIRKKISEIDEYPFYFIEKIDEILNLLKDKKNNELKIKKIITELYRNYSLIELERNSYSGRLAFAYSILVSIPIKGPTYNTIIYDLVASLKNSGYILCINENHLVRRIQLAEKTNRNAPTFILKNIGEYRGGRPVLKKFHSK
ncbi:MAG: hypothetical protein L6Q37_10805 [Bdellovibrionaceae bacterium]|nr:hypothetical protein [Pseudobdellovibrionaceae bacterium]NUM58142.1 hypothetical protein [Pseudobdellovibrionaceae bacterium]